MKTLNLEDALASLSDIRRTIVDTHNPKPSPAALNARLVLLTSAATAAGLLGVAELVSGAVTQQLLRSQGNDDLRMLGLTTIGIGVFLALATLYCVLEIHASRASQDTELFVKRHFAQLSLLSFGSDLFVKFAAVSAVIIAEHPELVAPLLLIFTGDYLLQGRLFTLPLKASIAAGLGTYAVAIACFSFASTPMSVPFLCFTGLAIASIAITRRQLNGARCATR